MADLKIRASNANAQLTSWATDIGASPILELWDGAVPATLAATPAGTKIVSMTLPASPFGTAATGSISKSGTWSGTAIASTAAVTFYRIKTSGGVVVEQGLIGESGSVQLIIDNDTINIGQTVTVSTFTRTHPNYSA